MAPLRFLLSSALLTGAGALASSQSSCIDDESSLLQARVQKSKKSPIAELLESSKSIALSLKSGETPPEAVNNAVDAIRLALEQIGPMLQEEHSNAQSQIDRQLDEIQACHTSSVHGSTVMGDLAGELATMTQCMADQASANEAQELHCSEWSNHAHQLSSSFPSCSPPSSAGLEEIYSTFQNMQNWIDDQRENTHSKYTACAQATTHATDETARCAPVIAEYDERFCQHELACSLRTACHDHEVSVYNALVSTSEEGMVARQEHHHTIEQVDCILHLISAAVEAQETIDDSSLENCRAAAVVDEQADHVQEHLTLSFPTPEAWSACGAPQPTDPQCTEVELPQAWFGGQASSLTDQLTNCPPSLAAGANAQWTLVLQYGDVAYTPTQTAVGNLCDSDATGFAKLSDDSINALPGVDNGPYGTFDYWMFTSDLQSSSDVGRIFVRTPRGSFNDLGRNMGWDGRSMSACWPQNAESIDQCQNWRGNGCDRFDTECISGYVYDCRRWFMDYSGASQCYTPADVNARCLSGNHDCGSSAGSYAIRTGVKMYKLSGEIAIAH